MNLKHLMNEYFDQEERFYGKTAAPVHGLIRENVPVVAQDAFDWKIESHPNRLVKSFLFKDRQAQRNFVNDLMEYEEEIKHNAKIVIEDTSVTISVYTHYLEDITEMDQEYAYVADEIYKDSNDAVDE